MRAILWLIVVLAASFIAPPAATADELLKVVATTPDLGSLAREVGGDSIALTVLAKPTEDPHFLEAKPSFIKAASEADLFILTGMELETGWAPPIIANSRNERIQPGARGYLEACRAITPVEVPTGPIDRSMGDVHSTGNPHFLTDPVCGLKVAALIAERLGDLRPVDKEKFQACYKSFRDRVGVALAGDTLARKYDVEKLAVLQENGRLLSFLEKQGDAAALGGWWGLLKNAGTIRAVADHNLWPYLARRFNVEVTAFLEPKPGVPPTTRHLQEVIAGMKQSGARLILTTVYFDPRHADFVARETGARVAALAHMPGARPGTSDYISMCDYNVHQLVGPDASGASH